jgi:hypothetical protein
LFLAANLNIFWHADVFQRTDDAVRFPSRVHDLALVNQNSFWCGTGSGVPTVWKKRSSSLQARSSPGETEDVIDTRKIRATLGGGTTINPNDNKKSMLSGRFARTSRGR